MSEYVEARGALIAVDPSVKDQIEAVEYYLTRVDNIEEVTLKRAGTLRVYWHPARGARPAIVVYYRYYADRESIALHDVKLREVSP